MGIFRLAPDAEDCAAAKKQMNAGTFEGASDVNVVANLIKVLKGLVGWLVGWLVALIAVHRGVMNNVG